MSDIAATARTKPISLPVGSRVEFENLSLSRAKYVFYYPLILAIAALLLWVYPTDIVTAISSAIGTVICVLLLWEYLFTNCSIRLSRICVMGLTAAYAAGTLNSWLTVSRGDRSLASVIGQTVPELAGGIAAALMGCAILLSLGELFEKPILTSNRGIVITSGIKKIVLISFIILVAAFAGGKFQQGGAVNSSANHAGFLAMFLLFLLPPTVVLATTIFLVEPTKAHKYLFGCMTICLWAMEATQGRRNLVYPALVMIGLVRYAGYRWNQLSLRRIVLLICGVLFLFVGVLTYQLLRLAGDKASSHSIVVEAQQAWDWVQQGQAWKITTASSEKNVKLRSLDVVFLSSLLYQTRTKPPARGKDLLLQTQMAIPSIIDKHKQTIQEETLASQTFGVYYPDLANSLFTAGAVDFGIWGALVYPIIAILLYSEFLKLLSGYVTYDLSLFAITVFILTAISAEEQLSAYFISVRGILIFSLLLYSISKLPTVKWFSVKPLK